MKKMLALLFALSMAVYAQDINASGETSASQQDDISAYTSGAPAPETPLVNINETKADEPSFFISLHPISLMLGPLVDMTFFYVSFETNISAQWGLVLRPVYFDVEISDKDEDLDVSEYGLSLGLRYYIQPLHCGFYIEPLIEYDLVRAKYSDIYHYDAATVKGFVFSFGALGGYKVYHGHFSMFMDIGYEYSIVHLSGRYRNDVEDASAFGFGVDMNFGIGVAF